MPYPCESWRGGCIGPGVSSFARRCLLLRSFFSCGIPGPSTSGVEAGCALRRPPRAFGSAGVLTEFMCGLSDGRELAAYGGGGGCTRMRIASGEDMGYRASIAISRSYSRGCDSRPSKRGSYRLWGVSRTTSVSADLDGGGGGGERACGGICTGTAPAPCVPGPACFAVSQYADDERG